MNMKADTVSIEEKIAAYEAIQKAHLDKLKILETPDLKEMKHERRLVANDLKSALTQLIKNTHTVLKDKISIPDDIEKSLSRITEVDNIITQEIKRHQERLIKRMNQLKKGKTAVQGYKHVGHFSGRPRVLSISR
jgi:hypothetical protein